MRKKGRRGKDKSESKNKSLSIPPLQPLNRSLTLIPLDDTDAADADVAVLLRSLALSISSAVDASWSMAVSTSACCACCCGYSTGEKWLAGSGRKRLCGCVVVSGEEGVWELKLGNRGEVAGLVALGEGSVGGSGCL